MNKITNWYFLRIGHFDMWKSRTVFVEKIDQIDFSEKLSTEHLEYPT